jgi:hypothetical protein
VNTTGLIEVGWAAIVPDPNWNWPDLPSGTVMEWLVELGELAHRHVNVIPELRAKYSVEEMDRWFVRVSSIPGSSLRPRPLFLLCADLRVWDMRLDVPRGEADNGGTLNLEEWAIAHVNTAAAKAFRAMIDVLLDLQQKETPA